MTSCHPRRSTIKPCHDMVMVAEKPPTVAEIAKDLVREQGLALLIILLSLAGAFYVGYAVGHADAVAFQATTPTAATAAAHPL